MQPTTWAGLQREKKGIEEPIIQEVEYIPQTSNKELFAGLALISVILIAFAY